MDVKLVKEELFLNLPCYFPITAFSELMNSCFFFTCYFHCFLLVLWVRFHHLISGCQSCDWCASSLPFPCSPSSAPDYSELPDLLWEITQLKKKKKKDLYNKAVRAFKSSWLKRFKSSDAEGETCSSIYLHPAWAEEASSAWLGTDGRWVADSGRPSGCCSY